MGDKGGNLFFVTRIAFEIGAVEVGTDHGRTFAAEQVDGCLADARAGAAVYLASPASTFMTGQTMIVDGGSTIGVGL